MDGWQKKLHSQAQCYSKRSNNAASVKQLINISFELSAFYLKVNIISHLVG